MFSGKPHALIEIACFNAEPVLQADKAGVDHIEFCADRTSGGGTNLWRKCRVLQLRAKAHKCHDSSKKRAFLLCSRGSSRDEK
jgi:hypothetical protein